ncbi:choice-of-anchor D domain-containing protein, partial [candidate division KSB1 bacterium]|nr:choice-of-anchor D domain-containing protein [candidate division KSB1 bacterium]
PLVFNVLAAYPKYPDIAVTPDTLKFEARIGEAVTTDQESFLVSNGGEAVLNVSNISGTQTWVQQISVKSFSLNPQANRQVSVTVGIGSLSAGTYQGTIRIDSNDPDTPVYSLPAVFNILPAYPKYPNIAVSPDTLKFEARIGEAVTTDQESFLVSNGGEAVLNVSNISSTQTWVQQISLQIFTLNPQANRQVSVTVGIGNLTAGTYQGTIRIDSNDPDTPVYNVPTKFVVIPTPSYPNIIVEADTLFFRTRKGNDLPQDTTATFTIRNDGEADLTVSNISSLNSWYIATIPATFTLSSGGVKNITVRVTDRYLNPGEYYGRLTIQSNDPDSPSYVIRMQINVLPALPHISVEPKSLTFLVQLGDISSFDTAYVEVTNSGLGSLNVTDIASPAPYVSSISPRLFMLNKNVKQKVEVIVNGNGLIAGVYKSYVRIFSNDPDVPDLDIGLTFNVIPAASMFPDIFLDTDTLVFQARLGDELPQDTSAVLTIRNIGDQDLHITDIRGSQPWIAGFSKISLVIAPGMRDDITVLVTKNQLSAGIFYDTVHILSNDPDTPDYPIHVNFTILEAIPKPAILVHPDTLIFEMAQDQAATCDTGFVIIGNLGNASLEVTDISSNVLWITSIEPASFSIEPFKQRTVMVVVSRNNLGSGTRVTDIIIQSNDPSESWYPIHVIFNLRPYAEYKPHLSVWPDTLKFNIGTTLANSYGNGYDYASSTSTVENSTYADYDTLHNNFDSPFLVLAEENRLGLKMTRLVPSRPCEVLEIRIGFSNQDIESHGSCFMYSIRADDNGKPGELLWINEDCIFLEAGQEKWQSTDFSDMPITVGGPFWIGHSECYNLWPAMLMDSYQTPGTNMYLSGGEWVEDTGDYLQMAIVNYLPREFEPVRRMWIYNIGTDTLHVSGFNADFTWLKKVDPPLFSVPPEWHQEVEVQIDAANLSSGFYEGTLFIQSNDEERPDYPVYVTLDLLKTDVPKLATNVMPAMYRLDQNYPNPFNPETTIRYYIPESASVSLTIFNTMGQTIKTVVDTFMPAGDHVVVWQADDDTGTSVSSGIYIYRLKTDRVTIVRKMILLR